MKRIVCFSGGLLCLGLLSLTLAGCDSSSTKPIEILEYRAVGNLVQEMNDDHAFATVRFWRNDTVLTDASVRLTGVPMAFFPLYQEIDSAYQALISPAASHAASDIYLVLGDGSRFSDSVMHTVVDTFSITDNFDPPNHQLQGAGQVSLEWTAALNAEGYILAAVKADEAYTGAGYSALAATVGTAGTIPPDAFIDPISQEPDTGLYNIYVYAYSGAPDSALAGNFLPVPWPLADSDDIDRPDLNGRFGSITVALRDTVRVVLLTN